MCWLKGGGRLGGGRRGREGKRREKTKRGKRDERGREGKDVLSCLVASAKQSYPDKDTMSSSPRFSFSLRWLLFKLVSPLELEVSQADSVDSGPQSSSCRSSGTV